MLWERPFRFRETAVKIETYNELNQDAALAVKYLD
jgi:hypothetical protein